MEFKSQSKRPLILAIIFGCLAITAAVVFAAIYIVEYYDNGNDCSKTSQTGEVGGVQPAETTPTPMGYKSGNGKYKYAAMATESKMCSDLSNDILARQQGNAVDAAIAAMLCTGVEHPQSSGIGGGSFFVIYDKKHGWHAVDSRETAPAKATQNMYVGEENQKKSVLGGMAVGVPGYLRGLIEVHERFGVIPWKDVVMPIVNILRKGFKLLPDVHEQVVNRVLKLENKTGFGVFLDDNGDPLPVGSLIKMPKLADTFETVANDPYSFYNGSLAKDVATDISDRGGIITSDDLKNYKVDWKKPTEIPLPGNLTVYSMPPPGSGAIISYILSILAGYHFNSDSVATDDATILTYHRIVEAMKFAYGQRSALGDERFVDVTALLKNLTSRSYGEETRSRIKDDKTEGLDYYDSAFYTGEDAGTNHLCVVDGAGNAVAVTTTINTYFGSKVIGERTGIVFNNEMDDFSTPNLTNSFGFLPSASNFILPGKRPQSSMSPTIVWDGTKGRVRMLAGAAGGSRIISTTAQLLIDVLMFDLEMPAAMDRPRFHHQLMPMEIVAEPDLPSPIREGLKAKGHTIRDRPIMSVAHAIEVTDEFVEPASDFRKGGQPAGY